MSRTDLRFPEALEQLVIKTGLALYFDGHLRHFDRLNQSNFEKKDMKAVARIVHFISAAYTRERDELREELSRLEYQIGYLLYYLPINFLKVQYLLNLSRERWPAWIEQDSPRRVLDLGSGPGTAGLAFLDFWSNIPSDSGQSRPKLDIHAVDFDSAFLRIYEHLVAEWQKLPSSGGSVKQPVHFSAECLDISRLDRLRLRDERPFDIIIMANSLNELFLNCAESARIGKLAALIAFLDRVSHDDTLLIILDPALKSVSQQLSCFHDALLASRKFSLLAPCLNNAACPIAAGQPHQHWCHLTLPLPNLEGIRRIEKILGKHHKFLKFSHLVARKVGLLPEPTAGDDPLPSPDTGLPRKFQCLDNLVTMKMHFEILACSEFGLVQLVLPKKDKSDRNHLLKKARQGSRLVIRGGEWHEPYFLLDLDSVVEIETL
jgi:ribosomal protein RSM22 (predicted rRNA methylase)